MAKSRECLQSWGSQDRRYQNQDRLERMLIGINIVETRDSSTAPEAAWLPR